MNFFFSLFLVFLFSSCARQKTNQERANQEKANQETTNKAPLLIVLDPGHGGSHNGATRKNPPLVEKEVALQCALKVRTYLEKRGYDVVLTRTTDSALSLEQRVRLAKKWHGDLFVSLHFNHAANQEAHGIEVFYAPNTKQSALSKKLATCILSSLVKQTKAFSRGVKEGNFRVLRKNSLPAVLVEGGFFSNAQEAKKLATAKYLDRLAHAIAQGIDDFIHYTP